ncbi:hypothetical protein BV25DRAFT_1830575 [Artomyces pyxidatus]|uniref:Uncharacterized protein n=1 Tax=Artomyces pyxidatus TaxID=48021 RepID=A0ACB8SNG9_9AGAM|nr:hypothetical protein BV25DRAFT_1830575 [Artomyces pyxidatus]
MSSSQDRARCFAQQPLHEIPRYLFPSQKSIYLPPLLHYGWTTTLTELMDKITKICPEELRYFREKPGVSAAMTLATRAPIVALLAHIGVPDDKRIAYTPFEDSQGKVYAGITAGNNYSGVAMEGLSKLDEFFGKGELGKYYLDMRQWKWAIEPFKSNASSGMLLGSTPAHSTHEFLGGEAGGFEDREKTPTPASPSS